MKGYLQHLVSHHIQLIRVTCLLEHLLGWKASESWCCWSGSSSPWDSSGQNFPRLNQSSNLKCRPPGQSNHRSVVSFVKLYFSTEITISISFSRYSLPTLTLADFSTGSGVYWGFISHHLPGILHAAAGGGAQAGDGDGVLLKQAGPGEASINLLPRILVPRLACLVVLRPSSAELD